MARTAKKAAAARSRKKTPAAPTGLMPLETRGVPADGPAAELSRQIDEDGGAALAAYREPLGGHWVVFAALPLEQVAPTPYQRDLSDAHLKRLAEVISKTGWYLDPVIALRVGPKRYQTPNGHHRASAMKSIGARSVMALVVTEPEVARRILALNVEKAHNLHEKCLEVVRLARDLAALPAKESEFALEFEEPAFLTLGLCYDARGRFAGGAYQPMLKRCERFLDESVAAALERRALLAARLLAIDDTVTALIAQLKAKGLDSPYLRNFVVARLNPIRFDRGAAPDVEELLGKLEAAAAKFDPSKIGAGDIARSGAAATATEQ
jgi:ParB family chromosome partitioning protein